jgi:hypothetical protein
LVVLLIFTLFAIYVTFDSVNSSSEKEESMPDEMRGYLGESSNWSLLIGIWLLLGIGCVAAWKSDRDESSI